MVSDSRADSPRGEEADGDSMIARRHILYYRICGQDRGPGGGAMIKVGGLSIEILPRLHPRARASKSLGYRINAGTRIYILIPGSKGQRRKP